MAKTTLASVRVNPKRWANQCGFVATARLQAWTAAFEERVWFALGAGLLGRRDVIRLWSNGFSGFSLLHVLEHPEAIRAAWADLSASIGSCEVFLHD